MERSGVLVPTAAPATSAKLHGAPVTLPSVPKGSAIPPATPEGPRASAKLRGAPAALSRAPSRLPASDSVTGRWMKILGGALMLVISGCGKVNVDAPPAPITTEDDAGPTIAQGYEPVPSSPAASTSGRAVSNIKIKNDPVGPPVIYDKVPEYPPGPKPPSGSTTLSHDPF